MSLGAHRGWHLRDAPPRAIPPLVSGSAGGCCFLAFFLELEIWFSAGCPGPTFPVSPVPDLERRARGGCLQKPSLFGVQNRGAGCKPPGMGEHSSAPTCPPPQCHPQAGVVSLCWGAAGTVCRGCSGFGWGQWHPLRCPPWSSRCHPGDVPLPPTLLHHLGAPQGLGCWPGDIHAPRRAGGDRVPAQGDKQRRVSQKPPSSSQVTAGRGSVLEHVAEQLLHGGVANGTAEEEQLDALGGEEAQGWQKQQQLPKPGGWSGVTNPAVTGSSGAGAGCT